MDMKQIAAGILLILLGGLLGAFVFPNDVEVIKEVKVVELQEVPGAEVIVEKEVLVEDTDRINELNNELKLLKLRYEQLTGTHYLGKDVEEEVTAIERAISDFESMYMYKLIRWGFTPDEISIVRTYNEEVSIEKVDREVNGIEEEYDKIGVNFTLKAKYSDEDGVRYAFWDVEIGYDLDSEGNEDIVLSTFLV